MTTFGLSQPLFDSYLFRALREVARGEVRAFQETGELRYRNAMMPGRAIDAVCELDRLGYVRWHTDVARPGWITADLTMTGTQLLGSWMLWAGHAPTAA